MLRITLKMVMLMEMMIPMEVVMMQVQIELDVTMKTVIVRQLPNILKIIIMNGGVKHAVILKLFKHMLT